MAVLSTLQGSGVGLGTVGKAIDLSRVRGTDGNHRREEVLKQVPFYQMVEKKKRIPHPQHSSTPWLNYLELLV